MGPCMFFLNFVHLPARAVCDLLALLPTSLPSSMASADSLGGIYCYSDERTYITHDQVPKDNRMRRVHTELCRQVGIDPADCVGFSLIPNGASLHLFTAVLAGVTVYLLAIGTL